MTTTYSYEKAKKNFDIVFDQSTIDGKVAIRKDNITYMLTPVSKNTSPLDVGGVDINISVNDILTFIHESRKN